MHISLRHADPRELLEEASWDDLLDALRELGDGVDEHAARILDFVYRHRLARASRGPLKDLEALRAHLRRVTHGARRPALEALPGDFAARWDALHDSAEASIEERRVSSPQALLQRDHVRSILADLAVSASSGRTAKQDDLARRLQLKPANMTRLMHLLEGAGWITRRPEGRTRILSLTAEGSRHARTAKSPPEQPGFVHELTPSKPTPRRAG